MLVVSELAEAINSAIGATDKDGLPISVTPEMEAYAEAVITTLTTATTTLPTVVGTAPPAPGPVLDLQGSGGLFLPPLSPATWASTMALGLPTANPAALLTDATVSTGYLTGATLIDFAVGTMNGASTAAPPAVPGVLVFLGATGGKLSGIDGGVWASLASPPTGNPALAEKIFTAIADYVTGNAEGIFLAGTVNGTFAAPGAPLVGGIGIGGTVA